MCALHGRNGNKGLIRLELTERYVDWYHTPTLPSCCLHKNGTRPSLAMIDVRVSLYSGHTLCFNVTTVSQPFVANEDCTQPQRQPIEHLFIDTPSNERQPCPDLRKPIGYEYRRKRGDALISSMDNVRYSALHVTQIEIAKGLSVNTTHDHISL